MPREIRDMVVVITGASSGIGRELAVQLAARGAKLALAARRVDRLEQLNAQLGGGHLIIAADVSRPQDCEMLVQRAIEHFGRIDTLVCNAGYGVARSTASMTHEEVLQIFRTNVFGTTDCIRAAVPHLRRQEPRDRWRGQIVIISSAMARRAVPHFGAYAATKASQLSFAEALRVELRPEQIAVTSVHPVGTTTEFFEQVEQKSGAKIIPATTGAVQQSAATVAKRIIAGIARPRAELWPLPLSGLLLSLATMIPRTSDLVLARYSKKTDRLLGGTE
jgi:short-subunit dehydrogenase